MADNPQKIKTVLFCMVISVVLNGAISFFYAVSVNAEIETNINYNETSIEGKDTINETIDISQFTLQNSVIGAIPIASAVNSVISFPFPISALVLIINLILSVVNVIFISMIVASYIPFMNV